MRLIASLICAAITSFVTALILEAIAATNGKLLYGYSWWFVIPIGAMGSGAVASCGAYACARVLNYKPTKAFLVGIVFISVATFFLIYDFEYNSRVVLYSGQYVHVNNYFGYWEYLGFALRQYSVDIDVHDIPLGDHKIGVLGYFFALLQIGGFALGGFVVFLSLDELPYCDRCSKYYKTLWKHNRYFRNSDAMENSVAGYRTLLADGHAQAAADFHAASGSPRKDDSAKFSSRVTLKRCSGCRKSWLGFTAQAKGEKDWNNLSKLKNECYLS